MSRLPIALLVLYTAALIWAQTAHADDPIPGCDAGVIAGRVELDAGTPAPTWCACYDDAAETCLIMRYRRCRADLTEARTTGAESLASCETAREKLQRSLREAAVATEQARGDLQAAAPPWWDRAWIGAAGTAAVAIVVTVLLATDQH